MKTLLVVTILGLSGIGSAVAVSPSRANAQGQTITTIRSRYSAINDKVYKYRVVKKDLPGYSAEGGTLVAYLDGTDIKKIVNEYFGETGKATEEFYFWKGKLIFVYRRDSIYDRPLSGKVISTNEQRFYFDNGRMIRWINKSGKFVETADATYSEKEREYLASSAEFLNIARS